jgi:NitT/TauT family transport system substrate-binding protein
MNLTILRSMSAGLVLIAANASPVYAADLEEVTYLLPAPPNANGFIPWMVAQQRGYYAKEGLKVSFASGRGGMDVAKQVGAGNAVIGGAIGDTAIVARAQGIPVRVVALLGGGAYHHIQIISDSGLKDIQNLKGKTVNVMSYEDTSYITLLGVLAAVGLSKDNVNIQSAGPTGVWQNAVSGRAVAFAGPMTWAADANNAGKAVLTIRSDNYFPSMAQAILASDRLITTRPDLIQKLVRATLLGLKDVMDDPDGSARDFINASAYYKDREKLVGEYNRLTRDYTYVGQKRLGESDPRTYEAVQKFYVDAQLVPVSAPIGDLFTNQFIQ